MDTQHGASVRKFLSKGKLSSLVVVILFSCILLVANHIQIFRESGTEHAYQVMPQSSSNVKESVNDKAKPITVTPEKFQSATKTTLGITTQVKIVTDSVKIDELRQEDEIWIERAVHRSESLADNELITFDDANSELAVKKDMKEKGKTFNKEENKDESTQLREVDKYLADNRGGNIKIDGQKYIFDKTLPNGKNSAEEEDIYKFDKTNQKGKSSRDEGDKFKFQKSDQQALNNEVDAVKYTFNTRDQMDKSSIKEGDKNKFLKTDQNAKNTKEEEEDKYKFKKGKTNKEKEDKPNFHKTDQNDKNTKEDKIKLDKTTKKKENTKQEGDKQKAMDSTSLQKTNDQIPEDGTPTETKHYRKDVGSDYVKTKYIMHKLLKENGPELSPKQRAKLVKKRCETFLKENNIQLNSNARDKYDGESFMTSHRYNLSICYNCKVASTNTKRVLYALDNEYTEGINNVKKSVARKYFRTRMESFQQMMSEKRRINVMMVREPLERLLSAYRDERAYKGKFGDPSFSFEKYLQLILNENVNKMNRHIYPYFERCRPCEMQFDFIGLQRNFNDDISLVLKKIGASGKVGIPKRKKTGYESVSSEKLLKEYYKKIPNDLIHKLWENYYKDYYIFGFPYPAHLMNL